MSLPVLLTMMLYIYASLFLTIPVSHPIVTMKRRCSYSNLFSISFSCPQNLISLDTVKDAVSRLFLTRMRLGEFDPPEMNPYTK